MKLWDYQEKGVTALATKLAQGIRKIVMQLATGGGKTIMFAAISSRYIGNPANAGKSVLILVHRKELLQQTRRTLFNAFGISPQIIVAGMRHIPPAKVYVAMIESTIKRLPQLADIGLVIIDEAHISSFNKIHDHFPAQFIIGFTATPLSANKKLPMKSFYDDIVCGVGIKELIALNKQHPDKGLCQNITFAPRDTVDRAALSVKGNDFDDIKMAATFSKPKYINNTVEAYKKYAPGTKAIIFNVNIEHSKTVNNAFKIAGFESRHLDGDMADAERKFILQWFENTPGAILNNVGIATTGTDIPSIETVIYNKSTMSMPLWLQSTGRGGRPFKGKIFFTIIDMGGNAIEHGDWCDEVNWQDIFFNPKKKKAGEGVAPVKVCPECEAIISASANSCNFCGYIFPAKEAAIEQELSDFIVVTKGINVAEIIEANKEKKEYYPFYKIGSDLAASAGVKKMTDEVAFFMLEKYNVLAKEWCHAVGKRFNQWHQVRAKEHLFNELAKKYKKWNNPIELPLIKETVPLIKETVNMPMAMTGFNFAASNFFDLKMQNI